MNCFTIDHSIASTFTDELYDTEVEQQYNDNGYLILPWGGGGYSHAFAGMYEVALLARYRYQKNARPLTDGSVSSDHTQFDYDLSGVDASLSLTIYLAKRSDGK